MKSLFTVVGFVVAVSTMIWLMAAGIDRGEQKQKRESSEKAHELWEGPCKDESVLVATTTGSPNSFQCWNKHHRMRVEVATKSTNEEAAAIVFCECDRGPTDGGAL